MVVLLAGSSMTFAQIDQDLRYGGYEVDVELLQERLTYWQDQPSTAEKYAHIAFILNLLTDYDEFIGPELGLQDYTDDVISAAESGLALDDQQASLYAFLAEGLARKITGAITGIRFGGRLSRTVEAAEALDPENEDLRYLQAKRYLLAPSLGGGDRDKARATLASLVEQYPQSYLYSLLFSQALQDVDPDRAAEMAAGAEALRKKP